ncbi:MAG: citrate lyase holo-[Clostridia bacterium]|nr:citrate lyase holo-[acyl-carrier protein] synthase [Clostridia bacterium]
MREITLTEMLEAREKRSLVQNKFIEKYGCPIICFTMNIPGPLKNSPLIERAFREGLAALGHRLPKSTLLHYETESLPTGCTAFYAVDMDVLELKKICTAIEDSCELGRLFDMDVIDKNGNKL